MNNPKVGEIWRIPFHGTIMYFRIEAVSKEALAVIASELPPIVLLRKYFDNPLAERAA